MTPTPAQTVEAGTAALVKFLAEMNLSGALNIISAHCKRNPAGVSQAQATAFTYIQNRMEPAIAELHDAYQALLGLQAWINTTTGG